MCIRDRFYSTCSRCAGSTCKGCLQVDKAALWDLAYVCPACVVDLLDMIDPKVRSEPGEGEADVH
eukprot:1662311-Rhodomonas_salina.1